MRTAWGAIIVVAVGLALTGCGGDNKGQQVTQPASATVTPLQASPLPPTWTDVPPGFLPSETPASESGATATRVAPAANVDTGATPLPPTWTPGRKPTRTPYVTETPSLPTGSPPPTWTPLPSFTPLPAICAQLEIVGTDSSARIGASPIVQWIPVPGFDTYRIDLRHPGGGILMTQVVTGDSFEFPADLFTVEGAYGWGVSPLDSNGEDTCYPAGSEIIVTRY